MELLERSPLYAHCLQGFVSSVSQQREKNRFNWLYVIARWRGGRWEMCPAR